MSFRLGTRGGRCERVCRYVEIAVRLLQSGRHSQWKAELERKKLTHLAFDTVSLHLCGLMFEHPAPAARFLRGRLRSLADVYAPGVLGEALGGADVHDVRHPL